jgi:hypothetical protein
LSGKSKVTATMLLLKVTEWFGDGCLSLQLLLIALVHVG